MAKQINTSRVQQTAFPSSAVYNVRQSIADAAAVASIRCSFFSSSLLCAHRAGQFAAGLTSGFTSIFCGACRRGTHRHSLFAQNSKTLECAICSWTLGSKTLIEAHFMITDFYLRGVSRRAGARRNTAAALWRQGRAKSYVDLDPQPCLAKGLLRST